MAVAAVLVVGSVLFLFTNGGRANHNDNQGRDSVPASHGGQPEHGPHGGRLLTDGDFAVEISIVEHGELPRFRVYCLERQQISDCRDVTLSLTTRRLVGDADVFHFTVEDDYLVSRDTVAEPHSFDIVVEAQRRAASHHWEYSSYEGRTQLTPDAIASSGIVVDAVGAAFIKTSLSVHGRVVPREDHVTRVIPRYAGLIKELRKRLGDEVAKDEVVAVVESNESLQRYEVRSGVEGTVVQKDATLGEYAREGVSIYTVADLSRVWVELYVPRRDAARVRLGQPVDVSLEEGKPPTPTLLSYVSPLASGDTQSVVVRGELSNLGGEWRPGWLVSGEILVEKVEVPVAIRARALQTLGDWLVVFVNQGDVFEAHRVEVGRRDADWIEVLDGIDAGQSYVVEQSFLIKAEIAKGGASHDH